MPIRDVFDRPLRNLRLSVTDRCNLRCQYCMPEEHYVWLPREDLLSFEEIGTLADVFIELGVDKIRLTGGEPLLRRDLPALVRLLATRPGLRDLALTTNGVLLADQAEALRAAGLHRVTVSLDTLDPERFAALTRFHELDRVHAGIAAASRVFGSLKIDTVVIGGVNDGEIVPLLEYAKTVNAEIRFIEYMDVGGATQWSMDSVVSRAGLLDTLARRYGPATPLPGEGDDRSAPADRFRLPDGTTFGIISSTTAPFCADCDRSRLTADGMWLRCLYATHGTDLRGPLRAGASPATLQALLTEGWQARRDRGAEHRLAVRNRETLIPLSQLKRDPHLEMHTRGG
ncbi:MAG TPA: GTP 3',8-cyclase MoaA [Vicinamibacterales bacterium]|nr:GTP 3',8-cyclase MoaA [Vicinamibacterales bacterium]